MQAFALKDNWAERFEGGSLARRDGTTLNVGEELARKDQTVQNDDGDVLSVKPNYVVAVDDHDVALLGGYEPLKQVPLKEATKAAPANRPAGGKESD